MRKNIRIENPIAGSGFTSLNRARRFVKRGLTKREREREARKQQEEGQEVVRRAELTAKVLEKIKSGSRLCVTPQEAERLILEASRTKRKYHGPTSIVRAFRAF